MHLERKGRNVSTHQTGLEPGRRRGWMLSLLALMLAFAVAFTVGCGGGDSNSSEPADGSGETASADTDSASDSDSGSDDPIVIGFANSQTGGLAAYDVGITETAKIVIDEINANGGINGRKLEAVISDSASDPVKAGTAAEEVLSKGADLVIVACDYDLGQAAARAATQAGVVSMQCAGGDLAAYDGLGALHYNVQPGTPSEGTTLAQFAIDNGWKKTALLVDTQFAYDTDLCKWFEQEYTKRGGEIVERQEYKATDTAIPNQVSKIASSGADAVIVCAFLPSGGAAIKQLRDVTEIPIMSGLGMDGTEWIQGINNPSDIYLSVSAAITGDDPREEVNEFFKKYEEVYGHQISLGVPIYGAQMVDLFAKAVEEAGTTDAEAVAKALDGFTEVESFGDKFTFTDTCHRTPRPHVVMEIQNGELRYLTMPEVEDIPQTC